jgi:CheY-like chemotaxis protein
VLNINGVVAEISRMLRRIIGEDVQLVTNLSETLANARLDSDQLGQILLNLAVNARDAMPKGGTLHIETANAELDNSYTKEHPPVIAGNYVMLAVSDTGTGVEKETLPRIFDPFFTTKEIGKGTGLGLSIVYGIVKQSRGYIWVYSEPGTGTTFKLYFPATNAPLERPRTTVDGSTTTAGKTVLLVDDETGVRTNIRECLQQLGYHVYEADCGEAALETCRQQQGKIDVVLTDLVMPGMSGHELGAELAQQYPEVRILFMSGYTEDNAARRAILTRGSSFLQKPFSVADLSGAVQRLLESPSELART